MSNESNRNDERTISPGELQASDFFPPGEGWNKMAEKPKQRPLPRQDDDAAIDGGRPH